MPRLSSVAFERSFIVWLNMLLRNGRFSKSENKMFSYLLEGRLIQLLSNLIRGWEWKRLKKRERFLSNPKIKARFMAHSTVLSNRRIDIVEMLLFVGSWRIQKREGGRRFKVSRYAVKAENQHPKVYSSELRRTKIICFFSLDNKPQTFNFRARVWNKLVSQCCNLLG